ncbi:MAG: hypothetical protein K8T91_09015 [Planctomycetes bacterium]|nr:hypothetical protein [Planctomycetota bacterium]
MRKKLFRWIFVLAAGSLLFGDFKMGHTAEDFATAQARLLSWTGTRTAAGNNGDFYDNRDGQHSPLKIDAFPGLQQVPYTKEELRPRGWGLQTRILPGVTFGNSSTSGPVGQYGSHIRGAYSSPHLVSLLYQQYTKNNLYIYPEHQDHDPGHNGQTGHGDLMPLNTPYLIGTQGSSGSDHPAMLAVGLTLGSFQPATKKRLIETGLLMPTVQMLFRTCQAGIASKEDYLSGKAHPSVFDGPKVQYVRLAEMAHALSERDIPSMVQLKVLEEESPRPGVDYFEPGGRNEKLCDTPAAIGRIFRGRQQERKLVVSAEDSYDLNGRLRTFHWVVLRGDHARIKIEYRDQRKSIAEITVPYHARAPIPSQPTMESNRVDIGVFVHNGRNFSAPAFLCFYSLDNERRRYDDQGRILEIDYTTGNFVDRRLTIDKPWRDVYQYQGGQSTGWTRHYADGRTEQYTEDGRLLRPATNGGPVAVDYRPAQGGKPGTQVLRAVPRS